MNHVSAIIESIPFTMALSKKNKMHGNKDNVQGIEKL